MKSNEEFNEVEYRKERKLGELEIEAMLWEYDIERMFEKFEEKAPIPKKSDDADMWLDIFNEQLEKFWKDRNWVMGGTEDIELDHRLERHLEKMNKEVKNG